MIKRHSNGYWYRHYYDGTRSRVVSLKTKDRAEAEVRANAKANVNLSSILSSYLEEKSLKVSSLDTLTRISERLIEAIGKRGLSVDQYIKERQKVVSGPTIRRELGVLIAALNLAVRRGLLSKEDVPMIELPEPSKRKEEWATLDQLDTLLEKAPKGSRVERFLWIAIETGARKSAILSLKWSAICFNRGLIDFSQGVRETKKRRAIVPISDRLLPILQPNGSEYVLDHPGELRKSYARVTREAGLEWITPNVIRHSWASNAAMAGVSFVEIARVLGNSVPMVEKVYSKFAPDYLRSAVNFRGRDGFK